MVAETMQLDGGALVVVLAVFILIAAAAIAVVVMGFVLARKAARGSDRALAGFVIIVTFESLFALQGLLSIFSGELNPFVLVLPALIALQIGLYAKARRDGV